MTIRDITYSSSENGDEDIYLIDCEGKNIRRCTEISQKGETNRTPEWSPNGEEIAFQSNRDGQRDIYIFNLKEKTTRRITHSKESNANHPTWSLDGSTLVFVDDFRKRSELIEISLKTGASRKITPDFGKDVRIFNPAFGPECKYLYFVAKLCDSSSDNLWRMELATGALDHIDTGELSLFEFDLNCDGQIVFDAVVDFKPPLRDWDIFTMNSDGSGIQRLTEGHTMSSRPKWLSDNKTIVFHTNRFGKKIAQPQLRAPLTTWFEWWNEFELCLMSAKGKDISRLTNNVCRDLHPDG